MSRIVWNYYGPQGQRAVDATAEQVMLPALKPITVGARELAVMLRARESKHHQLVLSHDRESNVDRMAARRLTARGLLHEPNYMGGAPSSWKAGKNRPIYLYVYTLTDLGRSCWLRTKASE